LATPCQLFSQSQKLKYIFAPFVRACAGILINDLNFLKLNKKVFLTWPGLEQIDVGANIMYQVEDKSMTNVETNNNEK